MAPNAALGGFVGLMTSDAAVVTKLAMQSAAQYQPFVDPRLKAVLVALVRLHIIRCDSSRRAMNQVSLAKTALIDLVGRTFKQGWIVINDRVVDADRLNNAKLVQNEDEVGENTEMRRPFGNDLVGPFLPVITGHFRAI